MNLLKYITR